MVPLIPSLLSALVLVAEVAAAVAVGMHAAAWLHLWLCRRAPGPAPPALVGDDLPFVTVQLPLYNEAGQVAELLAAVGALDWPVDRLEIQVLDDSDDDTPVRVAGAADRLRSRGLAVHHLQRPVRTGFKAGALAHGLTAARGELIAIFDADFRPRPDFLRRAVAALGPDIGLVQARWSFRNPRASLRTRAQALHLDAHFALEQQARSSAGLLMGFNGTAGVWRRACIDAAGGWHADTLTEDLDLAFRAQLAGWRLAYVDALDVSSELPDALPAIRAQQHRWIRGGAQVARKLLGTVWRSPQPLRRKLQATAHLLASSVFLPVLVLAVLLPLLPWMFQLAPAWAQAALVAPGRILQGVLVVLVACFGAVCLQREGRWGAALRRLLADFPLYLGLATAMAPWCARAAWMGWRAPTGRFERTPKGAAQRTSAPLPVTLVAELWLATWSWVGVGAAVVHGQWTLAVFITLQALALSALTAWTLLPRWSGLATPRARALSR